MLADRERGSVMSFSALLVGALAAGKLAAGGEHSQRRYAAGVGRSTGIPEFGMSQRPTNPLLGQRCRVTSVIGVYQQDQPSMLPRAQVVPHSHATTINTRPCPSIERTFDNSPVISTPTIQQQPNQIERAKRALKSSGVCCNRLLGGRLATMDSTTSATGFIVSILVAERFR